MAFLDRAKELRGFAAANHVDEILHVAVSTFELLHDFARFVVGGCTEVFRGNERTALAIDHVAHGNAAVFVHRHAWSLFAAAVFVAATGLASAPTSARFR